ncbi:MAG: hypothetical protein JSW14_04550 [Candidatus Bathyarchaeum sp.]|nr:MAG: hypothetical protein JSW14_04550 [Candidatus Bathyarchaeum sp.]
MMKSNDFKKIIMFGLIEMAFTVVCHRCGEILYEGKDMISLYRLRAKCNGRCPVCEKQLSISPLSIKLREIK